VTVGQDAPNPNGPLPGPTADPGAIETGAATAIPADNRPSSRSFLFFDRTQSVFGEDLRIRHGHEEMSPFDLYAVEENHRHGVLQNRKRQCTEKKHG